MLPIIATALKLLPLVQGGVELFNNIKEKDKPAAAQNIVDLAAEAVSAAGMMVNDPNLIPIKLRSSAEAKQQFALSATQELDRWKIAVQDVQHARVNSVQHKTLIDSTAQRIMVWNLPFVMFALIVQVACMVFFQDNGALLAIIGNVVGMLIQAAFAERAQVTSFLFGASIALPKDKQDDGKNS